MNRSFILSRPEDYGMAVLSQRHLTKLGWDARIMIDPTEWAVPPVGAIHANYSTQGRGMFGVPCAAAIAYAIHCNSGSADVVAKFDCDIKLTKQASEWMMAAENGRCFMLGHRPWGGCWAANHNHLGFALARLMVSESCSCPESGLIVNALRDTGCLECHTELFAEKWVPWRDWPVNAGLITLPTRCAMPRRECGELLFGQGVTP